MTEKPLHVRVAEALGCKPVPLEDGPNPPGWFCECVNRCPGVGYRTGGMVPRYDTDWSATGPLIEKLGASVEFLFPGDAGQDGFEWLAHTRDVIGTHADTQYTANGSGPTPLGAVCNLILELAKAGKLAP